MSGSPALDDRNVFHGEPVAVGGLVSGEATYAIVTARAEIARSLRQRIDVHARTA